MIRANNPKLSTWIPVPNNSDFPIQNIPFGICLINNKKVGVSRIGDSVINLSVLFEEGCFKNIISRNYFANDYLNSFLDLNKKTWRLVRDKISELFSKEMNESLKSKCLSNIKDVTMCMPVRVGDYTDFYSSRQHAYNVGCMFRDPNNALLPNWLHIPVGYHGRASSIVISDTPIIRPKGQQITPESSTPSFGPSKLLDFELEMAFITGKGKSLGNNISTNEAEEYIFGMVIFNDWSARDIQKWEYVPLGPFLGKSFASSISPWIVTLDALQPFKCSGEKQIPKVLPYLEFNGNKNIDINLEVLISSKKFSDHSIVKSNYKYMYWNMCQQLAHHTINGCNINSGDMMASGTISGKNASSFGSMLELSWKGTKPLKMPDGSTRKFINDNDTITMKAFSEKNGLRIGFGNVRTKVLPAT